MAKILIIEDEQSLVKNLSLALAKHQVSSATTAAEGLEKIKTNPPDLILLDLLLPDMSGIELMKAIKSDEASGDVPVIVLTNLNDQDAISQIMAAGGKEYFIKSDWGIDELVEKIEHYL